MKNYSNNTVNRKAYDFDGFLAEGVSVNHDTRKTGINNNVLVIGPTGAGKTRNYVKPNIMQAKSSMIISDAKGSLYDECAGYLRARGFNVYHLDFVNLESDIGYNPMDYIRRDSDGCPKEQDVAKLSEIVIDNLSRTDPFWDMAARMLLQSGIAYVMENFPENERTLYHVGKLMTEDAGRAFEMLMTQHREVYPDSLSVRRYDAFRTCGAAEKMTGSIIGIMTANLSNFELKALQKIYTMPQKLDFAQFGRQKTALFLNVSDTDRSMDRIANLFWSQALDWLCHSADTQCEDHCLSVPVRLYLDDFATNVYIPDFDKIVSNIRSREIYCSIMLQSLSQLESLYGTAKAETIIGNCDQQLILGVQDYKTASFFSVRADVPASSLMNMPLSQCVVFLRGQRAIYTAKLDVSANGVPSPDIAAFEAELSADGDLHHNEKSV